MKNTFFSLKNKIIGMSLLAITTLAFSGCGQADETDFLNTVNDTSVQISSTDKYSNVSDDIPSYVTSEFKNALAKQKVTLTGKDYAVMRDNVRVEPKGEWTPGPENDSSANLSKHFTKHGHDFKPPFTNEKDYFNSAIKFANAKCDTCNYYLDLDAYNNGKNISVVKWNSKTYEFTVVRLNGQTATYFIDTKLKAGRFILIPQEMR